MSDQHLHTSAPPIDHALAAEAWKMHDRWPADPSPTPPIEPEAAHLLAIIDRLTRERDGWKRRADTSDNLYLAEHERLTAAERQVEQLSRVVEAVPSIDHLEQIILWLDWVNDIGGRIDFPDNPDLTARTRELTAGTESQDEIRTLIAALSDYDKGREG